uniref:Uncharacterized protein n=1 Tax=Phenylobacterium glaciei TaxID=2803784 RepID=A0A974P297_9CAUL|nr:hypothetical protein JKL49_18615 [Phenylobacterium glaciei]
MVWEDVADVVLVALTAIGDQVAPLIEKRNYGAGVDAFLGVLVSVDDEDNSRFAKPHNRLGTVTDAKGRRFKQLSMAVELSPDLLAGQTAGELRRLFAQELAHRLNERPFRLARGSIGLPSAWTFNWPSARPNAAMLSVRSPPI